MGAVQDHKLQGFPPRTYAWTVVGIFCLATLLSYLDRQILNLLVDPIRQTMQISDSEISVLQGLGFIVFYCLFGIPVGRLADRWNRKSIIILGTLFASLMTMACGLADSFWELFLARAGVGIGEACLAPAAFSLIADYFPRRLRGRTTALVGLSGPLGSGLSFVMGGMILAVVPGTAIVDLPVVGQVYGWQLCFFAAGAPGLLIALLILFVREVPRRETAKELQSASTSLAFADVLGFVRQNARTLVHVFGAAALVAMVAYGVVAWKTSYYVREFGMPLSDLGVLIGIFTVLGAVTGGLLGGALSDVFAARHWKGGRFSLFGVSCVGTLPFLVLWVTVSDLYVSMVCMMMIHLVVGIFVGSLPSVLQDIVPNQLRGQMTAFWLIFSGIFGAGLGPMSVALASDYLFTGPGSLATSLLIVPTSIMSVALLLSVTGLSAFDRSRKAFLLAIEDTESADARSGRIPSEVAVDGSPTTSAGAAAS